ncbi:MAG: hypothetical protein CMJ47_06520 [Planctomyces sp.]|nr:hypothetical protein [Planctomyces sp.]
MSSIFLPHGRGHAKQAKWAARFLQASWHLNPYCRTWNGGAGCLHDRDQYGQIHSMVALIRCTSATAKRLALLNRSPTGRNCILITKTVGAS